MTEDQSIEAVKLLLKLGADASHTSANGENALFGPAYRGWNKLVQLLFDNGANVNVVSKAGITPWLAASGLGDRFGGVFFNPETAELLVRLGADPNSEPRVRRKGSVDETERRRIVCLRYLDCGHVSPEFRGPSGQPGAAAEPVVYSGARACYVLLHFLSRPADEDGEPYARLR